jgi:hypothetical protein
MQARHAEPKLPFRKKRRAEISRRGLLPQFAKKSARGAKIVPGLASAASLLSGTRSAGYSQNLAKMQLGTPSRSAKEPQEQPALRLTIVNAPPYVGRVTKAANEGRSLACQGLHNGPVLAYGFDARCF